MAEKKKDGGGAAAAPKKDDPAATPAEETKKRERLSFSREKKLAYAVIGLVALLTSDAVAKLLTEDQKAKVTKAQTLAGEVGGGDVLKPVTDRIAAIQKELKGINYVDDPVKSAAQAKELALELNRQLDRKKKIEELIAG